MIFAVDPGRCGGIVSVKLTYRQIRILNFLCPKSKNAKKKFFSPSEIGDGLSYQNIESSSAVCSSLRILVHFDLVEKNAEKKYCITTKGKEVVGRVIFEQLKVNL